MNFTPALPNTIMAIKAKWKLPYILLFTFNMCGNFENFRGTLRVTMNLAFQGVDTRDVLLIKTKSS